MTTVLYIEDNPDNVELVDRICEAMGHKMLVAINGNMGLALAEASLPDLILLDINLPDLDGYEIARRLRAHPLTQATPIVAVTANALKGDNDRAIEAGCNDYVAKPVIIGDLRRKMMTYLGGQ
jgi:CheY-like chemotaxis protein